MKGLFVLIATLLISCIAICEDVWVNGYTRKDGTYVEGYYRSRPNAYQWDNKSYKENEPVYNDTYTAPKHNYNSNWYQPSETRYNDNNPYNDNPPSNSYKSNQNLWQNLYDNE